MQKRLSLNSAAKLLARDTGPIVFLDTCVMLDIFRVVERSNSYSPFEMFVNFADKVKNHDVRIVYNETVEKEFVYNAPSVVKDLRSQLQNLNRRWNAFRSMKNRAVVNTVVGLPEDRIIHIAEMTLRSIRKDAIIVKDYDDALRSSYEIVLKHIAPAVRDSQFKDAYIFKTCLDLARLSGKQIIFCSVNTKDYCVDSKGRKIVHPDIVSQAMANNVVVTLSLGEAYGYL